MLSPCCFSMIKEDIAMNKFTATVLTTLMLGASLSALADDGMKGMDMSKMPAGSSMHGMYMGNMKK